jgi:hypothetical protein
MKTPNLLIAADRGPRQRGPRPLNSYLTPLDTARSLWCFIEWIGLRRSDMDGRLRGSSLTTMINCRYHTTL